MVLEKIGEFAAGGPHFADIRLQLQQLLLDCLELLIAQVVELRWIGLVVTENLRGHVDGREVVPDRDFSFVFRIPENVPGIRRLREGRGVIKKRIRAPHERDAVDLPVDVHQGKSRELRRELGIAGNFCEVERRGKSRGGDGGSHVARGRDDIVISSASAAKLGDQFVARSHIRGGNLAVIGFFEGLDEGRIGIAFPDKKVQSWRLLATGSNQQERCQQSRELRCTLPIHLVLRNSAPMAD